MFYFLCFFQKAENNRLKRSQLAIILLHNFFFFFLKIGSVGPVDQQINLISPKDTIRTGKQIHFVKSQYSVG